MLAAPSRCSRRLRRTAGERKNRFSRAPEQPHQRRSVPVFQELELDNDGTGGNWKRLRRGNKVKIKDDDESPKEGVLFGGEEIATGGGYYSSPLELLPREIWDMIFQNLTDAKDLRNCHNGCATWKGILGSKRTTFLFQEVIPIIATRLERNTILNCRRVCKPWRNSVDNYLQNHPCHLKLDFGRNSDKTETDAHFERLLKCHKTPLFLTDLFIPHLIDFSGNTDFCGFESSLALKRFLDKMSNHENRHNPFIMRRVVLRDGMFPEVFQSLEMWNTHVPDLLNKFGNHIWYCQLSVTCRHSPTTTYKILQQTVSLMPNLKTLEIRYSGNSHPTREMVQLKEVVRTHPIPRLEHLIQLKVDYMPYPIMNEVFSKWNHVRQMFLLRSIHGYGYDFNEKIPFQNLTEFSILLRCTADVLKLGLLNWPVKSLNVQYYGPWEGKADIQKIFYALGRFSSTLQNLTLTIHQELNVNERKPLKLHLPHLEKLKFCVNDLTSIEFLSSLNSLRELTLMLDYIDLGQIERNGSSVRGCLHSMYQSGIWNTLPKLGKLCVRVKAGFGGEVRFKRYYYDRDTYLQQRQEQSLSEKGNKAGGERKTKLCVYKKRGL